MAIINEVRIDEFVAKENLEEYPSIFSTAIKTSVIFQRHIKDFSSFSDLRFTWRLFQYKNIYVLTFGSDEEYKFENHVLYFGYKGQLGQNEVSCLELNEKSVHIIRAK